MLTPELASGAARLARMPVRPKPSGPFTRRQRQPASQRTPAGTAASAQTTESSASVRVSDTNGPAAAHSGRKAEASSRHTANVPANSSRFRLREVMARSDWHRPAPRQRRRRGPRPAVPRAPSSEIRPEPRAAT